MQADFGLDLWRAWCYCRNLHFVGPIYRLSGPSLVRQAHQGDPGELTLVRILTLCWLKPVFPGSHLQVSEQVGFKVESIALVSSRIWQSFLLIFHLVSPCLFYENKWQMTGDSTNTGGAHMQIPLLRTDMAAIWVCGKGFDKTFQDNLFSSIDYKWDTNFWARVSIPRLVSWGWPCYFHVFWPWSFCCCKSVELVVFVLWSFVERQIR